jgi:hypothetical protein
VRRNDPEVEVVLGVEVVTVHRRGRAVVVSEILGRVIAGGVERIYLDRLVHAPRESALGAYRCEGAISTVLVRPAVTADEIAS